MNVSFTKRRILFCLQQSCRQLEHSRHLTQCCALQVDIIFAVYDPSQKDDLAYRELLHALQKREGNMIYSKQMLEIDSSAEGQGVLACLRSCLFQS